MQKLSIRHAIIFLLVIKQNFVFAYVKHNVTRERTAAAKVFTNFLKVPWINLNSSWKDEVTSTCGNDVATLFEKANAGEMWALKMLDAASKIPSGILVGNIRDLGMYDECISARGHNKSANIQGRHCMVSLSMPPKFAGDSTSMLNIQKLSMYNPSADIDLSLTTSLCLPSSCAVNDVYGLVNASIQSTPELAEFQVGIVQVTCSSVKTDQDLELGAIITMSFFALVLTLLVLCTACDFVVRSRSDDSPETLKTFAKFSVYTNAIKLSSTKILPETMPAIHGIRFLSMCLVVMVHRILSTLIKPLVNLADLYELRESWLALFILMLPYAVDTFFIISGFFTAYFFLKTLQSGAKINILQVYLHRYIRLAPCMVVLLLFDIFILPRLGSGPIWETLLGVTSGFCRKNWWTNLLYIQNFVNRQEMCMPHTWYLAVEMQLFWVCPIILYPLFHRPKLGLFMLSLVIIASLIAPAVQIVVYQYSFLFDLNKNFQERYNEFFNSYTITYNRALPYFIGVLLGYFVVNHKRKLTTLTVTFNWIISCVFLAFCFWNNSFVQPNAIVYNAIWEAAYVSIGRFGWSLAVAWILYACTQGYGGPVARFLSLPMFVPLTRLSYCIYLVSAVIQVGINATMRTAEFNSPLAILYLVWSDLGVSIAVAFFLNLCFETPVIVLEKILRTKRSPSTIMKRASMRQKEKLLAIIREYLDLTRGRVRSDLEIETKMSQIDFWQTVSAVLNTLGKCPTKTPAEWAKMWEDWKCDLLKNDNERETHAKSIEDGSAECQTGITSLEKELLIFLAAVSCGLDDVASFKESEITEPAKIQLSSCGLRNQRLVRKILSSTSVGNGSPNGKIESLP